MAKIDAAKSMASNPAKPLTSNKQEKSEDEHLYRKAESSRPVPPATMACPTRPEPRGEVHVNLSPAELYERALARGEKKAGRAQAGSGRDRSAH